MTVVTETTYWLLAEIITIIIVVFICIIVVGGFGERVGSSETSRNTSSSQARASAQSTQAVIAKLRSALALREETIKDLRAKGRRVVADRDRWEAEANRLQAENAELKTATTSAGQSTEADIAEVRRAGEAILIDGSYVHARVDGLAKDQDLSRFIL